MVLFFADPRAVLYKTGAMDTPGVGTGGSRGRYSRGRRHCHNRRPIDAHARAQGGAHRALSSDARGWQAGLSNCPPLASVRRVPTARRPVAAAAAAEPFGASPYPRTARLAWVVGSHHGSRVIPRPRRRLGPPPASRGAMPRQPLRHLDVG
jgi:hypothetical protein